MKTKSYNLLNKKIDELLAILNGGKGSGNFGHAGRPGKRGGSGSGSSSKKLKDAKAEVERLERSLKELDEEGVPFTSPRYQGVHDMYRKAEADYLKAKTTEDKSPQEGYDADNADIQLSDELVAEAGRVANDEGVDVDKLLGTYEETALRDLGTDLDTLIRDNFDGQSWSDADFDFDLDDAKIKLSDKIVSEIGRKADDRDVDSQHLTQLYVETAAENLSRELIFLAREYRDDLQ